MKIWLLGILCFVGINFPHVLYAFEELKGLDQVSVRVQGLDLDTKKVGLTEELVRGILETEFQGLALSWVGEQSKPEILVSLRLIRMFGGYACSYRLQLRDWAFAFRDPKTKILVSTWEQGGIVSSRKKKIRPEVEKGLVEIVRQFRRDFERANVSS